MNEDKYYMYWNGSDETAQEEYGPKQRTDESWDDSVKDWLPVIPMDSVFFTGVNYRRKKSRG